MFLRSIRNIISEEVYFETEELVSKYGEYGVALELIIAFVEEENIIVTKDTFSAIQNLGISMQMLPSAWKMIQYLQEPLN